VTTTPELETNSRLETKMGPDLKTAQSDFASTFAAFREANDARLAEIEAKSAADPLLGETVNRLNTALDDQTRKIENLTLSAARPGARIVWLDEGLTSLEIDADYVGQAFEASVSSAGREGVAASFIYEATHLRPLSPVHLNAYEMETGVRLSWTPRRLDGEESLDASALFLVNWEADSVETSEIFVDLPFAFGQDRSVTVQQVDPVYGAGGVAENRL